MVEIEVSDIGAAAILASGERLLMSCRTISLLTSSAMIPTAAFGSHLLVNVLGLLF